MPPSPPAEKANARQGQARQASTCEGAGDRKIWIIKISNDLARIIDVSGLGEIVCHANREVTVAAVKKPMGALGVYISPDNLPQIVDSKCIRQAAARDFEERIAAIAVKKTAIEAADDFVKASGTRFRAGDTDKVPPPGTGENRAGAQRTARQHRT